MTRFTAVLLSCVALGVACGCRHGGDFSILGYTTAPPFDPDIRSVSIPVFKNTAWHTSPDRGIEVDLHQAIVDELNKRRSPIRVVSDPSRADTELIGTITRIAKIPLNRNLQNQVREFELYVTVELVWRDLRTGRELTGRPPAPQPDDRFDPSLPAPAPPPRDLTANPVVPVTINGVGRAIMEVGESNATANQMAVRRIAVQIVNMMEQPWVLPPRGHK